MKVTEKVYESFDKCQHGHQNLTKLADGLKTFYEKLFPKNQEEFQKEFLIHLKQCMVIFTREPAVERCMEFAARFAAKFAATDEEEDELEDDDNFYNFLFNFLLQHHSAHGKAVRFRVCQLVNLMLQVMPREATLDETLVDDITKAMLIRMYDIFPSIRAQAVRALNRLQQPTASRCPVIERYMLLLRSDESADVRSSVLNCIALNSMTLPEVIKRVRDTKESVRKIAYQVLAQKVSIKALTCSRRLYVVEQGLLDQSESVRNVVKTQLLQAWLRTYEGNILEVLEKLDCIGSTKITCMAVNAMFKFGKIVDIVSGFMILNENKVIDLDKLTAQSSFYWAQLCQFLRSKGVECEDYLDNILPSVTDFCKYLEEYFDSSMVINKDCEDSAKLEDEVAEKEFIAGQLLQIVSGYDLFDDAGRRRLKETIIKLTSHIDVTNFTCIVPDLARCLKFLHDSDHEDERVQMAAEMIQDAREMIPDSPAWEMSLTEEEIRSKQIQLAKIRVKIIELNEELDEQIKATEFAKAGQTQKLIDELKFDKTEIEESMKPKEVETDEEDKPTELKNDPATILKCLQIIKEVCSSISFFSVTVGENGKIKKRKKPLHPTLLTLVNSLILPSIANPIPAIREVAVECLGNCCLYSFELSAQHLPLFLQIIQADVVDIRIKALGGIVDILRIYGMEAFAPKKKDVEKERQEEIEDVDDNSKEDDEDIEDEEAYVTTLILTKIVEMLDEENADIRHAAASSLAMILVSGRVVSPAIFSRLVLLWYNPLIQDEYKTINKISSFLDFYPYMGRTTHDCIEEAVLPTLRTLFNAPNSSPLASVKVSNVAELLVHLTKPSLIKSLHTDANKGSTDTWKQRINWIGESSAHDGLAIKLSNEVLRDPQSINVNVLARTLSLLELSSNLQDNLKDLTVLCEQMLEVVKNKQAIAYLRKFQRNVLSLVLVRSNTPEMEAESPVLAMEEDRTVIENGSEENTALLLNGEKNEEAERLMIRRRTKSSQSTDRSSSCSLNGE